MESVGLIGMNGHGFLPVQARGPARPKKRLLCLATTVFFATSVLGPSRPVAGRDRSYEGAFETPSRRLSVQPVESGAPVSQGELKHRVARQKAFKLALLVLLGIVITLFSALLMLSLLRILRFQRRKSTLGAKAERTEYIDAWSRYRLKDDPTKKQGDQQQDQ